MGTSDDLGAQALLFVGVAALVAAYRAWVAFRRAVADGRIDPSRWATGPKTLVGSAVAAGVGLVLSAVTVWALLHPGDRPAPAAPTPRLLLHVVDFYAMDKSRRFEPGAKLQFGFSVDGGDLPAGAVIDLPLPDAFEDVRCNQTVRVDQERRVVRAILDRAGRPSETCFARIASTTARGTLIDVTGVATGGAGVIVGRDVLAPDQSGHVRVGVGVAPPRASGPRDAPSWRAIPWQVPAYVLGGLLSFLAVVLSRRVRRAGGGAAANVVTAVGVVGCVIALVPVVILAMIYALFWYLFEWRGKGLW